MNKNKHKNHYDNANVDKKSKIVDVNDNKISYEAFKMETEKAQQVLKNYLLQVKKI